ncbi:MAG: sensory rhodopsin transducer [Actinobacteria bacterium]|nr:sensory rhodopsin transducer [Actinomycetota bacterium]
MEEGKNIWLFPDGELPKPDKNNPYQAHEALIILNTSNKNANLKMNIYFSDKDPIENIFLEAKARRVKCIRLDKPEEIGGVKISPHVQYALRLESDVKVAVTFGRLDTSSEKLAYYVGAAYSY